MQRGHAVDRHAAGDAQIRHADLSAPDDRHIRRLAAVVIELVDTHLPAAGDLLNDLPYAGQQIRH